jgi:hypothetical protein
MQDDWAKAAKVYNRVVLNKRGFSGKLPIALAASARPTACGGGSYAWFGGNYEDKVATFAQFATARERLSMFGQNSGRSGALAAWQNRRGCVVDRDLPTRRLEVGGYRSRGRTTRMSDFRVGLFDTPATGTVWFRPGLSGRRSQTVWRQSTLETPNDRQG